MKTEKELNLDYGHLVRTLEYNPQDGKFRWLVPPCNRIRMGDVAGHKTRQGYWAVDIDRQSYVAHRLAWFVTNREWPDRQVVHLNGDNFDNRLENLALLIPSTADKEELTVENLRKVLSYDENTGEFTNLENRAARARRGEKAGVLRKDGYYAIVVDGRHYLSHRLAWFYVHGRWPVEMIDHVNGKRGDNRLANLREAKVWQNAANSSARGNSVSGIKGVSYVASKRKFTARLMVQSRFYNLGYFATKEEAAAAYEAAARLHAGDFARLN